MERIKNKILDLGLTLPAPPKPVGSYVPIVEVNDLIFISGQIPLDTNLTPPVVKYRGKIGLDSTIESGQEAGILCTLNALSLLNEYLGSLDSIQKIVKVSAFINAIESFNEHVRVINPASNFLEKIFNEKGLHSRVAVGVASLPLNSTVELDFIVKFK